MGETGPVAKDVSVGLKILIVDDEALICRAMEGMLRGQNVRSVKSASEGLKAFQEQYFDVGLCDLMMAGMTGVELYEQVIETRPELMDRFVFMSGGAVSEEAREFFNKRPLRRLMKPFSPDDLRTIIAVITDAAHQST